LSEALPIFAGFQFNSGGKTWEQVIPSALDEPRVVKTVRLEDAQRIIAELERQLAEARGKQLEDVAKIRSESFPAHTCAASRHVHDLAEALTNGDALALSDDPAHCAESMLATVTALWDTRRQLAEAQKDAGRYRWLRSRDLNTISNGGVFAGMTPSNVVLNEKDLDCEIDAAMEASRAD